MTDMQRIGIVILLALAGCGALPHARELQRDTAPALNSDGVINGPACPDGCASLGGGIGQFLCELSLQEPLATPPYFVDYLDSLDGPITWTDAGGDPYVLCAYRPDTCRSVCNSNPPGGIPNLFGGRGDCDGDCDVDLHDFAAYQRLWNSP